MELRRRPMADPGAVSFVEAPNLVEVVEDWTRVRSPSRALRRRRQGHPQRIRTFERPSRKILYADGRMYAHPVVMAEIRAKVGDRLRASMDTQMLQALCRQNH